MSHITDIRTQLRDQDCLIEALMKAGVSRADIEVHKKAISFKTMNGGTASGNIIIRSKTVKKLGGYGWNDIGFEKIDDGTFMAAVDLDERNFGQKWLDNVSHHYGVIKAKKEAESQGLMLTDEAQEEDGSVTMVFEEL